MIEIRGVISNDSQPILAVIHTERHERAFVPGIQHIMGKAFSQAVSSLKRAGFKIEPTRCPACGAFGGAHFDDCEQTT